LHLFSDAAPADLNKNQDFGREDDLKKSDLFCSMNSLNGAQPTSPWLDAGDLDNRIFKKPIGNLLSREKYSQEIMTKRHMACHSTQLIGGDPGV